MSYSSRHSNMFTHTHTLSGRSWFEHSTGRGQCWSSDNATNGLGGGRTWHGRAGHPGASQGRGSARQSGQVQGG